MRIIFHLLCLFYALGFLYHCQRVLSKKKLFHDMTRFANSLLVLKNESEFLANYSLFYAKAIKISAQIESILNTDKSKIEKINQLLPIFKDLSRGYDIKYILISCFQSPSSLINYKKQLSFKIALLIDLFFLFFAIIFSFYQ